MFIFFYKSKEKLRIKLSAETELLQERINVITESIEQKKNLLNILPSKYQRVSSLFEVSQKLIELIEPDEIFDFLIKTLTNLFPQADNILLFNFDREADSLILMRSYKQKNIIIEEKTGDVLDKWVLQHNRSLLIEDLTKDFRFDCNRVIAYTSRGMNSFVLSPLSIEYRFLGMVRLESAMPLRFTLDDSRILRNVCDLGVVVLERANLFKKAQALAITDSLTGLFVKDYFFQSLKEAIDKTSVSKALLSVIMLDIDNFKKINDVYGHMVGDIVLQKLARILSDSVGDNGIISRFGGEEFIILTKGGTKEEILLSAERIRRTVETDSIIFRQRKIKFTVSLGATFYPADGVTGLELVNKADSLMYEAKKKGKNKLCFS
ncbi:MAG: sensor domain-containing diguanylate cyclase [Candidatus Omnitrophica bacterium]|jgi:diguanylate cyclase (GGDEF)-like protein|nr:sensor domain-containing diguanylate cyclase [Candidatus Omnitrophota bacterium]